MCELSKIQHWVDRENIKVESNNIDNEREILQQVAGEESFLIFIKNILNDAPLVNNMAERSHSHNNGFDKIVILSSKNTGYKLTLHIWWPNVSSCSPQQNNVHNHRWNFTSIVVRGPLFFEEFETEESGERMLEYLYASPEEGQGYSLRPIGNTNLLITNKGVFETGICYHLPHTKLHRTYPLPGSFAATLMLQGPVLKPFTNVYVSEQFTQKEAVKLQRMTPKTLVKKLSHLTSIMHSTMK